MTVFITRNLSPDSIFFQLLSAQRIAIVGRSLVQLTPLPFSNIPTADWIFFSSQNAVHYFFQQIKSQGIAIPNVRWAALGEATAAALKPYIKHLDFTGNGDPETATEAFRPHCSGQTVLFPGARHSRRSVQQHLGSAAHLLELTVYDNIPEPNPTKIDTAVLVFTSPLNASAYFSKHPLEAYQKVIAIGASTAATLQEHGISDVVIAAEPGERALAEAVISLQALRF